MTFFRYSGEISKETSYLYHGDVTGISINKNRCKFT